MAERTVAVRRAAAVASGADNLAFNLSHVVPGFVQGTFLRRPFWVGFWSRLHPDPSAIRFIGRLRRKYASDRIRLSLLGKASLLVLDVPGIRHVLDHSPDVYAEPRVKRLGMRHFQPDALTISRGDEWRERRRFNEAVLATRQAPHPLAGDFLRIVREEVDAMRSAGADGLAWTDFARLFERLALAVIFGPPARDAASLYGRLSRLMRESNRIFGLRESPEFGPFYDEIRGRLAASAEGSLVGLCPHARPVAVTRPESQVPHWMFATRDTLAANTVHALALIVTHPEVEARVRAELAAADTASAAGIQGLRYLEACLDETMRLWPTTPMLLREALVDDDLDGDRIEAGMQVIIHNGFNHRHPEEVAEPDRFVPERWLSRPPDYRFNHMSNGPQSCAGRGLALFLARAVIAGVLGNGRYGLLRPALRPGAAVPHAIDTYRVRFAKAPPTGTGS